MAFKLDALDIASFRWDESATELTAVHGELVGHAEGREAGVAADFVHFAGVLHLVLGDGHFAAHGTGVGDAGAGAGAGLRARRGLGHTDHLHVVVAAHSAVGLTAARCFAARCRRLTPQERGGISPEDFEAVVITQMLDVTIAHDIILAFPNLFCHKKK